MQYDLYDGRLYKLGTLSEDHREDYCLLAAGLYVEFSDAQWQDHVWLLQGRNGDYISVRHDTGTFDVPARLGAMLEAIADVAIRADLTEETTVPPTAAEIAPLVEEVSRQAELLREDHDWDEKGAYYGARDNVVDDRGEHGPERLYDYDRSEVMAALDEALAFEGTRFDEATVEGGEE